MNTHIQFNIKKYNTGKYDVVTRHKHKAIIEATEPELIARIHTQPDCRGMFRYGFMQNGKRAIAKKDELDLMLVKKQ